ncbi:MAG: helix-turn-helix transcriptional regulator [Candidatus Anammoxibacter sp.]
MQNCIKKVLEEKAINIAAFARLLDKSRRSIYNYIHNKNQPSIFLLKQMSEILGCKMEDLIA